MSKNLHPSASIVRNRTSGFAKLRSPAVLAGLAGLAFASAALADPISTSFTFQGQLRASSALVNGTFDLQFRLYDASAGGVQMGPALCADNVMVTDGQFTVVLDFGAFGADARHLEVDVRPDTGLACGDPSGWESLSPRQSVTAAPVASYAMTAETATNAATATTATTAANATQLNGQSSAYYTSAANLTGTLPSAVLGGTYGGTLDFENPANSFAGTFSGNGASLINLNADQLTSGTIPSARVSGTYSNALTLSSASNSLTGNGAGLTSLNASNLASGTLPSARLSGAYTNQVTFSNPFNVYLGDGTNLVSLNASSLNSGTVPNGRLAGTYGGVLNFTNASNVYAGNGASLTALNASSLSTGTLPDARLSGTYTNSVTFNSPANVFAGNGAALTGLSASNLGSGTLPSAVLSGTYSNALTFSNASNAFTGSGAGLTALNASNLTTGTVADARLGANVAMKSAANAFGNFTNSFAGSVGIGQTAPGFPLNFASSVGDKISLFGNSGNHYGFGIQASLLQIHSDSATSDIAFGYGTSAAMTETMRIRGNGRLGIGTSAPATPLHVFGIDGVTIGSSATGQTSVRLSASAATNGYGIIQSVSAQGTAWGDTILSPSGGRVGVATAVLSDSSFHVSAGTRLSGITAESSLAGGVAITGTSTAGTLDSVGGLFETNSTTGTGLIASSNAVTGINYGLRAYTSSSSANAIAILGEATASGANFGVYGTATGASAFGVYANGRLGASGTKSFMIDHPLDPENKLLYHYSIESPEVLNMYSGIVTLDGVGEAWVELPEYFESINVNARYTLTAVGGPAPMLHVAEKVSGNRFKIAGGSAALEVSWEVKANRNDRFVQTYGAPVERVKVDGEKGTYLRPELYGQPASRGQINTAPRSAPRVIPADQPADQQVDPVAGSIVASK
jgi:hypothetical protein